VGRKFLSQREEVGKFVCLSVDSPLSISVCRQRDQVGRWKEVSISVCGLPTFISVCRQREDVGRKFLSLSLDSPLSSSTQFLSLSVDSPLSTDRDRNFFSFYLCL